MRDNARSERRVKQGEARTARARKTSVDPGRGRPARGVSPQPGATPAPGRPDGGESPPPDPIRGPWGLSRPDTLLAAILAVLVLASYFPAILGDFVWDDVIFTTSEAVREWSGLRTIWLSPDGIEGEGHYWPVTYTSFWLEHKLWGFSPLGFHAVNVLLHLANCLLLWYLMRRLAVPGAWLVAAVFAVHPVHVESVAWVIERKDLLSGLFYLTAALTWMRYTAEPQRCRHLLALTLFAAALLSKSVAVTLPAALLIWHIWKHGRPKADLLWKLVPLSVLALGITAADLAFYRGREVVSFDYSLVERALLAARALWFYVAKLAWPTDLAVIYPLWEVSATDVIAWLCLAAACASLALLWILRHRISSGPLAGALYFAITLSPVLGFVDYGYMKFSFVADRYQYLACIGLIAPAVGIAARGLGRLGRASTLGGRGLAAAVLAVLAWLTWQQSGIYTDRITYFTHIIGLNPEARHAHYNLSAALGQAGRYKESLAAGLVAEKQTPGFPGIHANLGSALARLDRFDEAEKQFTRALELEPSNEHALYEMAESLRRQGRYKESIDYYSTLLEHQPGHATGQVGLGNALIELGRYEEALQAMTKALELRPSLRDEAPPHRFLGRASEHLGRLDAAAQHFLRAVEIDPGDPALLMDLHNIRSQQGRPEQAEQFLRRARDLQQRDPDSSLNVAEALRLQGRHEEALESYAPLLEMDPDHVEAHVGRGNALFELGRFEEAFEAMAQAVALRPSLEQEGSVHRFMGRALQQAARFDEAIEYFRGALAIDPDDAAAISPLAAMLFQQKRYEEARELYLALTESSPGDAQAAANLAVTEYYLGQTDEAVRGFERALALDPTLELARTGLATVRSAASPPVERPQ